MMCIRFSIQIACIFLAAIQFNVLLAEETAADTIPVSSSKEDTFSGDFIATYGQVRSARLHHHHLRFQEGQVLGNLVQTFSSGNNLNYSVGYTQTRFEFGNHPKFRQRQFRNVIAKFGGFTKQYDRWNWDANVSIQTNTQHLSISRYSFFGGFLHGLYNWNEKSNLHLGVIGVTGMHYTRVLPIIGFDYTPSEKLKYLVVFPKNGSIIYSVNDKLALDATVRLFLSCQRLGIDEKEHLKRGLVVYRNIGAEVGLTYTITKHCTVNAHIGETFAGRLRVSRKGGRHPHYHNIGSAPYYTLTACYLF